ncbi:Alpha/Beta hydrolase protein [Infundibulicybe gibba]|nr:Alpha/Beta hydrolase protein [Infundibulicybe gibba]
MNGVYVPIHVVALLRRFVNVVSTISLSNHYFHLVRHNNEPPTTHTLWETSGTTGWIPWPWEMPRIWSDWSGGLHKPQVRSWFLTPNTFGGNWLPWLATTTDAAYAEDSSVGASPHNPRPNPKQSKPYKPPSPPSADLDTIHKLLRHPALYDPIRTPRHPIVLCHGLYGFDSRGPASFPSMRMHYWTNVLNVLRDKIGAEVIVTSVPGTGSITSRAESMDRQLQGRAFGRGVNFLAHSMGGLDCRHLITHVKPTDYTPLSLMTISTPHRGSPFMDWCAENIGIGKIRHQERIDALKASASSNRAPTEPPRVTAEQQGSKPATFSINLSSLPSSFTTLLLSILDSPAYANLTSSYLNDVFNPATPDNPDVKYFSVAGRLGSERISEKKRESLRALWEQEGQDTSDSVRPLWANEREWGNDGLVTVQSAQWGEFLGIMEGCDHWEMRGARGIEFGVDLPALPAIGLGAPKGVTNADGWGFRDWGRLVGAWRKEERDREMNREPGGLDDRAVEMKTKGDRESERERERERDDAVIKSSTDKLSAVVDWLVEQVPSGKKPHSAFAQDKPLETRNELASKQNLERFYIALSRKLYDEGL